MTTDTKGYAFIGRALPRREAPQQVVGAAQYTADIVLPNMLHGKILPSPHPHARILNIDISKAQRLAGVKAVVTGGDTIGRGYGVVPGTIKDELALAVGKVRYVGDAVAAVAAVDEDTAEEALALIDVEYEILPAVFDPMEAMQPGAPLLHEGKEQNITFQLVDSYGDVDQAFAEADYVREDTFVTQRIHAGYLEPHAALAAVDPRGRITIWTNNQAPFFLRRNLANTLGMDERDIRVISPFFGGGFGGKLDMQPKDFCAAFLAKRTGRPVRLVYTMEESLIARHRHASTITLKTGVKRDGTIMAMAGTVVHDGGAYISTGPVAINSTVTGLSFPFRVPNKRVEGFRVYTNKTPCGPVRGHGAPQARFAAAAQLEIIANELGIDPVDLLLKNVLRLGDLAHRRRSQNSIYGDRVSRGAAKEPVLTTCGLSECIEKAVEASGWQEKRGKFPPFRGIGIAVSGFGAGGGGGPGGVYHSGCIVEIHPHGEITVFTGASDIGQGSDTILATIAAETMGASLQDIRLVAADTELTPLDPGSYGSQVTVGAGSAVRAAANDAKQQLLEDASALLEVEPEQIEAKNGRFYTRNNPDVGVSLADVLRGRRYAGKSMPVVGHGADDAVVGPASSFCAQIAEVEVDPGTGQVKVVRFTSADDVGVRLNPMAVEGQIEGAISNSMGYAIYEELQIDQGQILNPSFLDLKIPTALEMPQVELISVETVDPERPFGAKESGEGPAVPVAAAIANAVSNALGIPMKSLPITPEKVLRALRDKKGRRPPS